MERKPWPIIVLAVIHFFEPIAKVLFYTTLWRMPIPRFISYMFHQTHPLELFLFLGVFPIAGVCILAVKRWSFYAFLALQVVTLGGHIYYHIAAPHVFPLWLIACLTFLNLSVVAYFLIPAVRIAYMDPRVRWWEAKPRYLVDFKGRGLQGKAAIDLQVSNISEGGLFVAVTDKADTLNTAAPVQVEFDFLGTPYSLVGHIRHYSVQGSFARYGVQFSELTPGVQSELRKSMRRLRKSKYVRQGRAEDAGVSFMKWAKTLLTTGHGLLPVIKRHTGPSTQATAEPLRDKETG